MPFEPALLEPVKSGFDESLLEKVSEPEDPEKAEKIAALKRGIEHQGDVAAAETAKATAFDVAAKALDIPGALAALGRLPWTIAGQQPPRIDPVKLREAVESITPQPKVEPRLEVPKSVQEFAEGAVPKLYEQAAGMVTPENALLAVLAKRFPAPVGGYFAGESLANIPPATKQLLEAKTPREAGAAAAELVPSVAVPALIARAGAKPTERIQDARQIETPAEVHGDVRPLETPAETLPAEESRKGVQPSPKEEAGVPTDEAILKEAESKTGQTAQKIAEDIDQMPLDEFVKWTKQRGTDSDSPTGVFREIGETAPNQEFVDWLKAKAEEWQQKVRDVRDKIEKEPSREKQIQIVGDEKQPTETKAQLFREAYERATGTGSQVDPGYEPPFPIKPEVAKPAAPIQSTASGTTKGGVSPEAIQESREGAPSVTGVVTDDINAKWEVTNRGRDVYKADLDRENHKDQSVVVAMKSAPSYPKLLAAYHRFKRSLHGKQYDPSVIEKRPWEMLDSSSGVMNAKSQMAKTLASLENAVFNETGLPRKARSERFRGGTGVDWSKVEPLRETITPSKDTPVGQNDAGEKLYERADGSRYRMRHDRKDKPQGYPDFGGDLVPVGEASPEPAASQQLGIVPPGATPLQTAIDWVREIPQRAKVMLAQMAGKSAPRTSTASVESGNALVHYAGSRLAAPVVARSMATDVLGPHHKDAAFGGKLGALLVQDRLMAIKKGFEDAGDFASADEVETTIGKDWSPFKTLRDFRNALRDPEIQAALQRHKDTVQPLAKSAHEEAGGVLAGPGLHTGAFVNLKAIFPETEGEVFAQGGRGNLENPLRRISRFFRQAKGTAEQYETDYRTLAERMVEGNYEEVAKRRMYKQLVDDGLAVINDPGDPRPTIGGKTPVKFTIERKGTPFGKTPEGEPRARTFIKNLWVRPDIAGEVRQALNTDGAVGQAGLTTAANLINRIQLAGPTDAVWHTANMLGSIAGSQGGKTLLADLARKLPGVNLADAIGRTVQSGIKVLRDSPEVQRDLAELADIGALRGEHKAGPLGRMVQFIDKSGRLVRNDMFDNLVKRGLAEDTVENRREFVNQMGQYNGRLMGQFQRFFKEAGFSPFIVAGRNFNRMAMRRLTADPGVKAASPAAAAEMRAIEAMGTIATIAAVPALINYFVSGNTRPDLKMGQIGTGKKDSEGKEIVIDPAQWTGLRRGMRISGAQAVVEGMKREEGPKRIARTAVHDILGGILHPWTGPAVTAASVAATGYDPRFYKESVDTKDVGENVKAALKQLNPVAAAAITAHEKDTAPGAELAKGLGGAFGVKTVRPATAKQQLADRHSAWMRTNPDPSIKADYERRQKEEFATDYRELDNALRAGNDKAATKALEDLRKTHSDKAILQRMSPVTKAGLPKPLFQGSKSAEQQFLSSLSDADAKLYESAREDQKREYERFLEIFQNRP